MTDATTPEPRTDGDAVISANVEQFVRQQAASGLALSSAPQTQMQAFADIDLVIGQLRDNGYADWPDILTRAIRVLAAIEAQARPAGARSEVEPTIEQMRAAWEREQQARAKKREYQRGYQRRPEVQAKRNEWQKGYHRLRAERDAGEQP